MNVILPRKNGLDKKVIALYIIVILICILSLFIAIYVQFYARIDLGKVIGVTTKNKIEPKTEEEKVRLKENFNNIFNNLIEEDNECINKKEVKDKSIIYTKSRIKEEKKDYYEVDVNIPEFNINNEKIKNINEEIENIFGKLAEEILNSKNKNIIYNVQYAANVKQGILSLIIKSNYKEGNKTQRTMMKTYCYDLRNNRQTSLEEIIRIEELDKKYVQKEINKIIELAQSNAEQLKKIGYDVYQRETDSEKYEIENSKVFYMDNDTLYVLYPYGNKNETSEIDIVIF